MGSTGRTVNRGHAQLGVAGNGLFERYNDYHDAIKSINPHYREAGTGKLYTENCALCTTAGALALKGYDVEAAPRDKKWRGWDSVFEFDWKNQDNFVSPASNIWYSGTDWRAQTLNPNVFSGRTSTVANKIDATMKHWGEKSFAAMSYCNKHGGGSHSVLVYRNNGETQIIDFQSGKSYRGIEYIKSFMERAKPQSTGLYRLDNAKIKDSIQDLDKIVVKKGSKK